MLFTTAQFVLLFLPLTLVGFFLAGRYSRTAAAAWLFFASVVFYGYWMPAFTWLLLFSIGTNFFVGLRIARGLGKATWPGAKFWLVLGIVFNLSLLAYFKYANFFVDNLNVALGTEWNLGRVILPIGISFYSFTQIAFLVDTYRAKVHEAKLLHYGLFVTYFPHLIAGPVLHHAQMMPQFGNAAIYRFDGANFAAGLAIFALGLLKKVVLADGVAPYADAIFHPVDGGLSPYRLEAWMGMLAYTLQLYFDFSGYSDMAIGIARLFGFHVLENFSWPYLRRNLSLFWRSWHISLSRLITEYVYIPLGGSRKGTLATARNTLIAMAASGLWHGAAWHFVAWGVA
ncbi:MAG: MBOAT family O-acyltransferase, partial [Rubrivivax sp.]|nr:MBOAT family O-acyltransferase [Rubrivivax sp.]